MSVSATNPPSSLTKLLSNAEASLANFTTQLPSLQETRSNAISQILSLATDLKNSPITTDAATLDSYEEKAAHIYTLAEDLLTVLDTLGLLAGLPAQIAAIKTELSVSPPHPVWLERSSPKWWSDSEVEGLNGLQFVAALRENEKYRNLVEKNARSYNRGGGNELLLPVNVVTGMRMEGAPNTKERIMAMEKGQWKEVFEFYNLHWCEKDGVEDMREEWCWFLGVPGLMERREEMRE